jgi:hypothetical protein
MHFKGAQLLQIQLAPAIVAPLSIMYVDFAEYLPSGAQGQFRTPGMFGFLKKVVTTASSAKH